MAALEQNIATGRRKTASARVFLRKGKGAITVNGKELDKHFHRATERMVVLQALTVLDVKSKFDILATVHGGGTSGQAGAVRHAITRALIKHEREQLGVQDDENGEGGNGEWHQTLRKAGFVTRDPRMVERKKVGRHKARKGTQFSKR